MPPPRMPQNRELISMRAWFSYGAALVIIIIVGLWLGTGTLVEGGKGAGMGDRPVISLFEPKTKATPAKSADDEPDTPNPFLTIAQREAKTEGAGAPVRSVQVHTYVAKLMPIDVDVRGETAVKATVTAASETTGTVASVNVTKGQTVKVGDLLCTLDPETRQAAVTQAQSSLAQANASVAQSQADYDTNQSLIQKGLATPNSARSLQVALEAAKASVAAAQAGVDNAVAELGRTKIYAKTAGIISDPIATVGAILATAVPGGDTCATIVQLDPILFTGSVPEADIGYARLGLTASVKTVTGQTLQGKVTYIAPVSDSATRSFPVEVELPNPGNTVRAGLTATATVDVGSAPAQLLPQSVLTLDDKGTLGLRAVDASSKVVFYPVTIVKDAREGIYVSGLPAKLDVITVGQEFVNAGDTVKAVNDSTNNAANADANTTSSGTPS
jgi:multidrug efflux system membrane fusion protein